jgi:hypothetical protein
MIGPTVNIDLREESGACLFALRGMNVRIAGSKIPYRDW